MKKCSSSKIYLLCGFLFTGIGLIFSIIAFFIATHMDELSYYGEGDIRILPFIFGLIGIVQFVIGIILLTCCRRANQTKRLLLKRGQYVIAQITGFSADYSLMVNRRPTYRIECSYLDARTRTTYVFQSENVARNPAPFIHQKTVRVFVDPNGDFNNYYVDIAPLLPKRKRW